MGDPEYVPEGSDPMLAAINSGVELTELMEKLASERLASPADDLTTALITSNIDGEALTHAELASFFILILTAGNETTRNSIAHGLWALTEHPGQRAIWENDIDGVTPSAVDEIVRWPHRSSGCAGPWPATQCSRRAPERGRQGAVMYNSANRDEDVFDNPYTFDVRRDPNPHVGFGAAGPHFCLGAHLARQEITVMFKELLRRFPADRHRAARPSAVELHQRIKHLDCTL